MMIRRSQQHDSARKVQPPHAVDSPACCHSATVARACSALQSGLSRAGQAGWWRAVAPAHLMSSSCLNAASSTVARCRCSPLTSSLHIPSTCSSFLTAASCLAFASRSTSAGSCHSSLFKNWGCAQCNPERLHHVGSSVAALEVPAIASCSVQQHVLAVPGGQQHVCTKQQQLTQAVLLLSFHDVWSSQYILHRDNIGLPLLSRGLQ